MYVLGYEAVLTARRASEIMGIDKGATVERLQGCSVAVSCISRSIDADTRQRTDPVHEVRTGVVRSTHRGFAGT